MMKIVSKIDVNRRKEIRDSSQTERTEIYSIVEKGTLARDFRDCHTNFVIIA